MREENTADKIQTLEDKDRKPFWETITMHDIYNAITTVFVFAISGPIVIDELSKTGGYDYIFIGQIPIPRALLVVIVSVILTTMVNNFRSLMTLAVIYLKNKVSK